MFVSSLNIKHSTRMLTVISTGQWINKIVELKKKTYIHKTKRSCIV